MKRSVLFDKKLANLDFTGWNALELNLLMCLFAESNDDFSSESNVVVLTSEHFRLLGIDLQTKKSCWLTYHLNKFKADVLAMSFLDGTPFQLADRVDYISTTFGAVYLYVRLTDEAKDLLDSSKERKNMFVSFDLLEFVQIQTGYAKLFYMWLKQNKLFGKLEFTPEEFRERLGVVTKSRNRQYVIQSTCLRAVEPFFNGYRIVKVSDGLSKSSHKKGGRKIQKVIVTFAPQRSGKPFRDGSCYEYANSMKGSAYPDLLKAFKAVDHDYVNKQKEFVETLVDKMSQF